MDTMFISLPIFTAPLLIYSPGKRDGALSSMGTSQGWRLDMGGRALQERTLTVGGQAHYRYALMSTSFDTTKAPAAAADRCKRRLQ